MRAGGVHPANPLSRPILAWTVTLALAAYSLAVLFHRIAEFPPLHIDEAWMGLFASRILDRGLYTPHEMNTYTGPLHAWLLAKVFAVFKPGMLALRLPGAALNAAVLLAMAAHLGRRFGLPSALAWFALFSSSAMFLLKSRIAWEVYALQPALLAVVFAASRRLLESKESSFLTAALFLAATLVGVQNHFIFISVPLSLFVAAAAAVLVYDDRGARDFGALSAVNLLMTTAFYCVKTSLSDGFWLSHKTALACAFLSCPLLFAGLHRWLSRRFERREAFLSAGALAAGARGGLKVAFFAGLGLFFAFHWVPLIQIWSGVVVFQRLTALALPLPLVLVLYAWAAFLLGTLFWFALAHLDAGRYRGLAMYEKLVVLWPVAYAAVFPLLRNTTSIRYYILPSYLFLAAFAVILPRLSMVRKPFVLASLAGCALFVNVCVWRETGRALERKPIMFRVGFHKESSRNFVRKESLYRLMESHGACLLTDREPALDLPLYFHMQEKAVSCRPGVVLRTGYCDSCPAPPFVWGAVASAT